MKSSTQVRYSDLVGLTLGTVILALPYTAGAAQTRGGPAVCTAVTRLAGSACRFAAFDDFLIATGNCTNITDRTEREDCNATARQDRKDGLGTCAEQSAARGEVCAAIGQGAYVVDLDPKNFLSKEEIVAAPNPLFPLLPGHTYVYKNGAEEVRTTTTNETKQIEGITVIVVSDVSHVHGQLTESTEDWFAQDVQGNVWYFGEIAQQYENGELVGIDGSWKTGVDGALPGIVMKALPQVGNVYRQEFALGEAEDMGEVLNVNGSATVPAGSCASTCVVTRDFSGLEPGADEQKFYAPGIGLLLTVDQTTGAREELIGIEVAP